MSTQKTIVWHCLPSESEEDRIDRLNTELHRIFFDGKGCCSDAFLHENGEGCVTCSICDEYSHSILYHGTPRFLESLDAMQLIVESGKFAEVREEFFHWLSKERYECTIMLYGQIGSGIYFRKKGNSRQEAFCLAALSAMNYTVIKEESNG